MFQNSLNKEFIDFLAINMFFSKHKEKNVLGGIDLYDENILNGKNITEAYEKVKNKLNAFAIGKMFEGKEVTTKYPFKRVSIDTFNNLSAAEEQSIVDSFDMMVMSTDADIKNFAYQVLAHVAVHDNYRYISGSVVSKLRAQYFGTFNEMYTQYLEPIIKEVRESELSDQEKRDLQWLKQRGINVSEPKTVRQKLVYHTQYDSYTSLIGNFAKYFFSDNRNARFIKSLKDTKFAFKPQEGDVIELIGFNSDKDTYVVEVDTSINSYDIMSPLAFSNNGIFIKESYESDVESLSNNKVPVNRVVYKKLKVINNGYLPSVLTKQYPYDKTKELVENAISIATEKQGFGDTSRYRDIDFEEPDYLQAAFDNFPDEDVSSTNEAEKENNSISNPTVQPNTPPVVSAEEYFTNPEADADALLKAQEDKKKAEEEELRQIFNSLNPNNYPSYKPIPQNTLTDDVINEISDNFEQYKDLLSNIGINSVEELMTLPDERKETLIQDICKG